MVRKVSTSTMRDDSFPFGNGTGKPTLVRGHLPLKFQWITHTKRLSASLTLLAVGVPALGSFPTSLGGLFRTLVVHAEQFQNLGHVFRFPNVVAHNVCESGWVRLGSSLGDQLIVELPREGEVRHAGGVDVPDLPTAEPVDGGRWDPKSALASATSSHLLADSGPAKHLVLDNLEQFVVHVVLLLRGLLEAPVGWHAEGLRASYRSAVFACTFVRFTRYKSPI